MESMDNVGEMSQTKLSYDNGNLGVIKSLTHGNKTNNHGNPIPT
jgi:hypothetical protein